MIKNIEWLNSNKGRNYPFFEGSSRTSSTSLGGQVTVLPKDFLVDLRLTGTKTFDIVGGNHLAVDYFVSKIQRILNTSIIVTIREIQRGIYNPLIPSTFEDIGSFTIPFGIAEYTQIPFVSVSGSKISGLLVVGNPLDFKIPIGTSEFSSSSTLLEARTCVPLPEVSYVQSLGKSGDSNKFTKDVSLKEGVGCSLTPIPSTQSLKLSFNPPPGIDCTDPNLCEEDKICAQPALMHVSGVPGNHGFNLNIQGENGIQASALVQLKSGGDPFEPSDYSTTGLLITYHGPIIARYNSGPVDSPDSYTYDLDCSKAKEGKSAGELLNEATQLFQDAQKLL